MAIVTMMMTMLMLINCYDFVTNHFSVEFAFHQLFFHQL